jgi:hypothetical protein
VHRFGDTSAGHVPAHAQMCPVHLNCDFAVENLHENVLSKFTQSATNVL